MPRVIVIGGANVDIKGHAPGPYIGGTSNPGEVMLAAGGVGRNIAENLARLGVAVSLMTVLGDDANGQFLRTSCAAAGLDLSLTITSHESTGTYLAILNHDGEMMSAVSDMRGIEQLNRHHLSAAAGQLAEADMLVADCNIPVDCLEWLAEFSSARGKRLLVEPVSVAKAEKLKIIVQATAVFAVTPNIQQIEALTRDSGEAALASLHRMGFANIVLHRGSAGAIAYDGDRLTWIDAVQVESILDVTGAGDAAVAGLVCGLLDGFDLATAARLGQCAAALKLSSLQSVAAGLTHDRLYRLAGIEKETP